MAEFLPKRTQLVLTLSLVSAAFAMVFFIVGFSLDLDKLGYIHLLAAVLLLANALVLKKGYLEFGRVVYFLVFNLGVFVTALYFGKESSVEFFLIFSLAVPFFIFSFRNEKKKILSFVVFALGLWLILFLSDFNLFNFNKLDPETASTYFYPLSMVFSILLITLTLQYFSYLNGTHYKNIYLHKKQALEASEAKSKFLSMMSHEVRTPLNAIVGLSHILNQNNPREDQKDNLEALHFSGKLLMTLLNNILDFSKMQSTKIDLDYIPTDLYAAVKQIRKLHQLNCNRKGIEFNMLIDKKIPSVLLDVVKFNQVLNNLLGNAIKFTNEGKVTLRIKKGTQTKSHVNVIVEVLDTGIGIPDHKLEQIWEPFSQGSSSKTKTGGTGLGLPIVSSIVEAMGSKINVNSAINKGSRFYFKLHLKKAEPKKDPVTNSKKDNSSSGKKVLLVDDNLINTMVGKQILESQNFVVDVSTDGLDAIEKAKINKYDLILMDLQMPEIDGFTSAAEIRKFNKDTPIIALSGEIFSEVKDQVFGSGMNGFILKPFEPKEFISQIDKIINKKENE